MAGTVPTEVSELSFTGNGATVDFPISFPIQATDELVVELTLDGETDATLQVEGVDYDVDEAPSDAPTVTMAVAPPADSTLHIERTVDVVQLVDLRTQGPFSPATVTRMLDKRTMVEQQLDRRIARLEALAALVSLAGFDAQLVEFTFTANAVDIENSFPRNVAVVASPGSSITGVAVVKVAPATADPSSEAVTVREWSWVADVLTIDWMTGLTPGITYTVTILCTSLEP